MNAPVTPAATSHVPAAARKQVKEANRLIAELNTKPGETVPPAGATPAGAGPDLPSVTVTAPVTPKAAAAPAAPAAPAEPENFEAKYKVLQGKYNAEVAALRQQAAETQGMLNKILTDAATARAAPAAAPAAPVKPEDRFRSIGVTDKQLEDYGVELLDLVERVANASSGAELGRLKREIAELKGNVNVVGTVVAENAQQKIYDALAREVGAEWPTINASDEFLAWLQDVDVFSGVRKLDSLQHAFRNNDAARVVGIFKAYIGGKTLAGSTPPPGPAVDRGTLIAPGAARGGTGEAPGSSDGKIWSEQEIKDFYQRARKGKIPVDEYANTEAAINRAMLENRIRVDRSTSHLLNNG